MWETGKGFNAGRQGVVSRCHTWGESQETYTRMPLPSANKAAHPEETSPDVRNRCPKRGIGGPQREYVSTKKFFK